MSTNINLIIRKDDQTLKQDKKVKIFNIVGVMSLIIVSSIYLVMSILIQTANPKSIKDEHDGLIGEMTKLRSRQEKLFTLNDRIKNIEIIMETRDAISKKAKIFIDKVPEQISINNFELDNTNIIITGQSKSLFAIGEFINSLTEMAQKKDVIRSLTLNSLELNPGEGVYNISIRSEM